MGDVPDPAHARAEAHDSSDLGRFKPMLETVGLVLAPVSVIAALLVYFGRVRTKVEADFFGVDPAIYGYSSQDHVVRSVAPLLGPLAICAALIALAVHVNTLMGRSAVQIAHSAVWERAARWTVRVGFICIVTGAAWQWTQGSNHSYLAPTFLGAGAIMVAAGSGLLSMQDEALRQPGRWTSPAAALNAGAKIALTFVIVFAAFGFAARLAQSEGFDRARDAVADLHRSPEVAVLSTNVLAINRKGVRCLPVDESVFTRRYVGLHLLAHRDGRYLLIPSGFDGANAVTLILEESPDLRVEIDASPALVPRDPSDAAPVDRSVRC